MMGDETDPSLSWEPGGSQMLQHQGTVLGFTGCVS